MIGARVALLVAFLPGCSILFSEPEGGPNLDCALPSVTILELPDDVVLEDFALEATSYVLNTSDEQLRAADGDAFALNRGSGTACIWAAETWTLPAGAQLRVVGDKPLVIVSCTSLDVLGAIDVGSRNVSDLAGAGADAVSCPGASAGQAGVASDNGAGGGGGGGGFGAAGGKGGDGQSAALGGNGGFAWSPPIIFQGGCPGGLGGAGQAPALPAPGGHGGGAILLVAEQLRIAGSMQAGGGGGAGATSADGGGGGGGGGGFIGLHAADIDIGDAAILAANGGGGGGGGDNDGTNAVEGEHGAAGLLDESAASGGPGGGGGGAGGFGGSKNSLTGQAGAGADEGAGGGGGAAGGILIWAENRRITGLLSPSASIQEN